VCALTRKNSWRLLNTGRPGVRALHALLRDLDPHHKKLGLKRVPTYTGDYLWLCDKHYHEHVSNIPDADAFR
jgi:internalin A